jgi:elongation factor P
VLDYEHHARARQLPSGQGRNLRTGTILDKSFISGDRAQDVRLDYHNVQYLYNDGSIYHFMDLDTYDQPPFPPR